MSNVVIVQVPLDAQGRPDLQLPSNVDVSRSAPGVFMVQSGGEVMVLSRIGTLGGDPMFVGCTTTPNIVSKLSGLGAGAVTLATARTMPTLWSWLTNQSTLRRLVRGGVVVGFIAPVCIAGQSPWLLEGDVMTEDTTEG